MIWDVGVRWWVVLPVSPTPSIMSSNTGTLGIPAPSQTMAKYLPTSLREIWTQSYHTAFQRLLGLSETPIGAQYHERMAKIEADAFVASHCAFLRCLWRDLPTADLKNGLAGIIANSTDADINDGLLLAHWQDLIALVCVNFVFNFH
jgi:hypothetical protein